MNRNKFFGVCKNHRKFYVGPYYLLFYYFILFIIFIIIFMKLKTSGNYVCFNFLFKSV